MLGSEYGWAKDYILEKVYFDEYAEYSIAIRRRRTENYKMLLAIASNPHTEEPKILWETLDRQVAKEISNYQLDPEATLDKSGFERLKAAMADNTKIVIK